jgi:hypothetical protein
MTQIICRASTCLFWEQGVCTSEEIEYEPDAGCLTFQDMGDLDLAESEEEDFDWDGANGDLFADDDDDDWDEDKDEDEGNWQDDWDEDDL